jgi:hypothetical protein
MRIEITAVVEVPDGTPMDAVEEWIEFEMGSSAGMSANNPLCGESLACTSVDVREG